MVRQEILKIISTLKIAVKNINEEMYVYSGYKKTFESAGSSFDNEFARNVIIFGVDNKSSSHSNNHKNNFLILDEGPTSAINGSFGSSVKKFSINFTKANTKFCLSLHILLIIVICLLMEKKSLNSRLTIKTITFQLSFLLEVYLMDLVLLSLEKYL